MQGTRLQHPVRRQSPEVVSGVWHIDDWISPFLELLFKRPRKGYNALRVKIFRPAVVSYTGAHQSVLIRAGTQALQEIKFPDESRHMVEQTLELPKSVDRKSLCISLRASRNLRPKPPDRRPMGIVLSECYLVRNV